MKVFVVGATGVLGRHVIPRLLERGHQVRAVVRQAAQAEAFRTTGVEAFLGDILEPSTLSDPLVGCDAALHLATAIPKRGEPRDFTITNRIRREGTRNLLNAAISAGVRRYVQQSVVFVYGSRGLDPTSFADESTPIQPDANPAAAEMEQMVMNSSLDWCILRGGWFYGPLSGQEAGWREDIGQGTLQLPGDGEATVSLVHEVDMARAVVLAAEAARPRSIYNVVDDLPVRYREFLGYIAAQMGAPVPSPGGPLYLPSLGCKNAKIKSELGWSPAYPTYRSGLV
jgi:nucleoside-diphosphate-sugar epimerase